MYHWRSFLLGVLFLGACRTHTVDDCRPACDAADQTFFAQCVAQGTTECQAGNRRCCALAADCVGDLDDQTVVSAHPMCMSLMQDECFAPCTAADQTSYEACLNGTSANSDCTAGDEHCCALAASCLGDLGDVTVTADGCCATNEDCPGQFCDPMFFTCMGSTIASCGDGMMSATEECDDHNTITESCTYGARSCTVCDAMCHSVGGAVHFCGDRVVDMADGEACDPPGTRTCGASCHAIVAPTCNDGIHNGAETDVDCGGGTCPACLAGDSCNIATDCQSANPTCFPMVDCSSVNLICTDQTICNDNNLCTDDGCIGATGGCDTPAPIDRDRDGEGPAGLGCGTDCADHDPSIHVGAAEVCGDGVDQDCDDIIDEGCP